MDPGNKTGINDWRQETQSGLESSESYRILKDKCAGSHVMSLIDNAIYYAYQRTKTVMLHMGDIHCMMEITYLECLN